ncbi:MAG: type VI secretion system baseplate subunit TssF [Planctomycetota bacterium]|nr:type VI secretion system baseplate subunit TssF [Planctomycetota bacterium]
MDPRLLQYYDAELRHLREMGGEFAAEFPKIASRLGLDGFECVDPYVERLLEGFAFLAARVQLKLDDEFPRFTQQLLEVVYPHYLAPTPSLAVVRFQPNLTEGSLAEGFVIPRNTALRSLMSKEMQTACEYRTGHDVTLWPLELIEAEYFPRDVATRELPGVPGVRAGVRFRLRTTAGLTFRQLALDRLNLFLPGSGQRPMQLYEQLLGNAVAVVVRPTGPKPPWVEVLDASHVQRVGFSDSEALLPYGWRSFQGYRLLQEYFAFPQRYLFVELHGLQPAVQRCEDRELDVVVLLNRSESVLEHALSAEDFALFCTPAVNLFPKRADRIHLTDAAVEQHVVPDRTRPADFEVHQITSVTGYGAEAGETQEFRSFYAVTDHLRVGDRGAYFTLRRTPRLLSSKQRRVGSRASYVGSEVYLMLVDGNETPYRGDLREVGLETLCTNRDLPLFMPVGRLNTDFTLQIAAPVQSVRCVAGPTKPKPPATFGPGDQAWRLISHLTLNYLSLADQDQQRGAGALRELLALYGDLAEPAVSRQIEGVRSVATQPIIRPVATSGPMTFARGLQVTVTCDETAFEGTGVFLLGAVLERFFAKYVSLNSFTETVIQTLDRGEIMRWDPKIGRRHTL